MPEIPKSPDVRRAVGRAAPPPTAARPDAIDGRKLVIDIRKLVALLARNVRGEVNARAAARRTTGRETLHPAQLLNLALDRASWGRKNA
ncbi:MAG TPA: hypothetical protein VGH98_22300 [Gemmatimonadaceae bacterium]